MQVQHACHDTLPWLISFSLDGKAHHERSRVNRTREAAPDLNNRNFLDSDRGGSHLVNHIDSGVEQPNGKRTDGTKPNPAAGSVRDALRWLTRDDYWWRRDAESLELGSASLRDLECGWVRDQLRRLPDEASNNPRILVVPSSRLFPFPSKG